MSQGRKVGVFATRSPHRYNNIGLSVASVRRVDLKQKIVVLRYCENEQQTFEDLIYTTILFLSSVCRMMTSAEWLFSEF